MIKELVVAVLVVGGVVERHVRFSILKETNLQKTLQQSIMTIAVGVAGVAKVATGEQLILFISKVCFLNLSSKTFLQTNNQKTDQPMN